MLCFKSGTGHSTPAPHLYSRHRAPASGCTLTRASTSALQRPSAPATGTTSRLQERARLCFGWNSPPGPASQHRVPACLPARCSPRKVLSSCCYATMELLRRNIFTLNGVARRHMVLAQRSTHRVVQSGGFLTSIQNKFRNSEGKTVRHWRYNARLHGAQRQRRCAPPGASWQPVAGWGREFSRRLRVSFSQSFCLQIRPNIKHVGRGTI